MRKLLILLILCWSSHLIAKVLNVEFNFTPYLGDPVKSDSVESVPGKAKVFLNNKLINEMPIVKDKLMVLFDDRQISAPVWITTLSLKSLLNSGKNTIRIEFEPTDPKLAYHAQLRWASVTDQVTTTSEDGSYSATNQQGEGTDNKDVTGKVIFEREFDWK